MAIEYVLGDATRPRGNGPRVIAHCCNDGGGWGSGFVVALSKRWSEPERAYRAWFRNKSMVREVSLFNEVSQVSHKVAFELGNVIFVEVEPQLWVANIIGQHGTCKTEKVPIRYLAIGTGLCTVAHFCKEKNATAHMPRLGAGLAKGHWGTIEEMILSTEMDATVYDL